MTVSRSARRALAKGCSAALWRLLRHVGVTLWEHEKRIFILPWRRRLTKAWVDLMEEAAGIWLNPHPSVRALTQTKSGSLSLGERVILVEDYLTRGWQIGKRCLATLGSLLGKACLDGPSLERAFTAFFVGVALVVIREIWLFRQEEGRFPQDKRIFDFFCLLFVIWGISFLILFVAFPQRKHLTGKVLYALFLVFFVVSITGLLLHDLY